MDVGSLQETPTFQFRPEHMIAFISQQVASRSFRATLKLFNKLGIQRKPDQYYFGYGANLNKSRFDKNQMVTKLLGTACLKNYKLSFGLQSQFKGLGYASVAKSNGDTVWGQLYKIDKLSLYLLDLMEFVPFGAYRRVKLPIEYKGKIIKAFVYVAAQEKAGLSPSPRYLNLIVTGAETQGYPAEYVSQLRATNCVKEVAIDHEFTIFTKDKKRKFSKQLMPLYQKHDELREKVLAYLRRFDQ